MFGLLDRDIKYIIKALEQHDEIEKAIIFEIGRASCRERV